MRRSGGRPALRYHAILHLDCAANGIDDASELYEDAVTRPLYSALD
jgi:hypothetical protein